MNQRPPIYGLTAEFDHPDDLLESARRAYLEGYRHLDAYSPFPVHGLADAIGLRQTRVPLLVLIGGIVGAAGGYLLQYWVSAIAYPLNIGGRPYHSWPAFVPIIFELMVLAAALSAVVGMLALNGLPQHYHPVFNVPNFHRASRDRFFLVIEATDPQFDREGTRQFMESLGPQAVAEAEP